MILRVAPVEKLKGKLFLPASKSYSIRSFIVAALGGTSRIIHPSNCEDAVIARQAAESLGAAVSRLRDNRWLVKSNPEQSLPSRIHVKESGTVLRFMIPLAAARGGRTKITGEGTLKGRPNSFLVETLQSMGADVQGEGDCDGVPVRIGAAPITAGNIRINGSMSSQFISALLLTLPLLNQDASLRLTGKIVSADYIDMTVRVMAKAGVKVRGRGPAEYFIKAGQRYRGLGTLTVPSDDGLAAFHLAAAALLPSEVSFSGHFNADLPQADGHIYDLLTRMGVGYTKTQRSLKMRGPYALRGGRFSLRDCPDLVPIMSILALFASGTTRLVDIGHARVKESDRISDLRRELLKIGADVRETRDQLIIKPGKRYKKDCLLDPHRDHRLAMAFAVLGSKIGVRVKDIECTRKSYPDFVRDFQTLGAALFQGRKRVRLV